MKNFLDKLVLQLNGGQSVDTILGRGSHVNGRIHAVHSVRINGRLEGSIVCEESLIVGSDAVINGTVQAQTAIIGGYVDGEIRVDDQVELRGSAEVHGELDAPELVLQPGALLEATCTINGEPIEAEDHSQPAIKQKLD